MNRRPALTCAQGFHSVASSMMFTVTEGVPAIDALEQASNLLACIESLSLSIATETARGGEAFAVFYLAEMAKALVDAGAAGMSSMEGGQ